jgi:hypothetical protein
MPVRPHVGLVGQVSLTLRQLTQIGDLNLFVVDLHYNVGALSFIWPLYRALLVSSGSSPSDRENPLLPPARQTQDLLQNTDGLHYPSFPQCLSRESLGDLFSDQRQVFHSFSDYLDPSDDFILQAN